MLLGFLPEMKIAKAKLLLDFDFSLFRQLEFTVRTFLTGFRKLSC